MASLNDLGKQFISHWKSVSFGHKLVIEALGLSSIVVIVVLARWATTPDMGLLYSGLDPKDASEIVGELDSAKVPYELRDGGSTVMVPSKSVYPQRLRLASQGLPKGGTGYEIFDKASFGMTDFAQQVNYIRALQGELARTVGNLQQVEWARVMIVKPERSLFVEEQKEATASVVIKMHGGAILSDGQIAGITHLVASSVEGLAPKNVVITDDQGNLLSKNIESPLGGMVNSQLGAQREMESYLASKAQAMLDKVLGPGKSVVKVSVDFDFRKQTEKKVEYDKDANKMPSRMTTRSSTTAAPTAPNAGPVNAPGAAQTAKGSGSTETEETTEYFDPLSHVERETIDDAGKIKRLSVAAFLSAGTSKITKNADGTETRQYQPATDADKERFVAIVKQAVGFDTARGDQVEINDVEFNMPDVNSGSEAPKTSMVKELMPLGIKYGSIVLVALIFVLFGRSILRRSEAPSQSAGAPAAALPVAAPHTDAVAPQAAPATSPADDVNAFARQNAADTTRVLRKWLYDNATEKAGTAK